MGVFDRRRDDVTDPDQSSDTTATTEGPPAEPEHAEAPAATSTDIGPLVERIAALEFELKKVLAEALQTGDFVRQVQNTLGQGVDAIRAEAIRDTSQTLMRAHSAVFLKRIEAEERGDNDVLDVLRRVESEIDAELAFVGITPIVPVIGDPIDTKVMRATEAAPPADVDTATARPTVERVTGCGYRHPSGLERATVTVRWQSAVDAEPQP